MCSIIKECGVYQNYLLSQTLESINLEKLYMSPKTGMDVSLDPELFISFCGHAFQNGSVLPDFLTYFGFKYVDFSIILLRVFINSSYTTKYSNHRNYNCVPNHQLFVVELKQ